jgi:hypothetical protein
MLLLSNAYQAFESETQEDDMVYFLTTFNCLLDKREKRRNHKCCGKVDIYIVSWFV